MQIINAADGRLYNQNETKWKSVTFTKYSSSGNSLYTSGCGIFSFCNAIYALNGNTPDAVEVATWAVNNGSFQPGNGGLYRQPFYNKIESAYGEKYNFKVNGQYYGSVTDSRLKDHLSNGGVAAIHVKNHFMSITGYDTNNNTYHVIESAVSSGRGLAADSWVSATKMSSGTTNVDWYALISNVYASTTPEYITVNVVPGTDLQATNLSWNSINTAIRYGVRIYEADNWSNQVYSNWNHTGNDDSVKLDSGSYMVQCMYLTTENGEWVFGEFAYFNVKATNLIKPSISVDKNYYKVGDEVEISWEASPSDSSLSHYWLQIYSPDGTRIYDETVGKSTSHLFYVTQSGNYKIKVYATPTNSKEGEGSLTDEKTIGVSFGITKPTISIDKTSYMVGDEIKISWEASPSDSSLSHYWLQVISPDGLYILDEAFSVETTSYGFIASASGNYTINTFATPLGSVAGEGSEIDTKIVSVLPKVKNISGDSNDDTNVNISDVVAIRRYLTNAEKYPLTEQGLLNADVVGNDGVNAQDAVAIQKYIVGIITALPVE